HRWGCKNETGNVRAGAPASIAWATSLALGLGKTSSHVDPRRQRPLQLRQIVHLQRARHNVRELIVTFRLQHDAQPGTQRLLQRNLTDAAIEGGGVQSDGPRRAGADDLDVFAV